MQQDRKDQQERLLAPRLPPRHYRKVDQIALPEQLVDWDWSQGGPLLHGTKGTGKTQAATRMAVEAVRSLRHHAGSIVVADTNELLMLMRRQMDDKTVAIPELARIKTCTLCIAEDLGKARPSEWVEETLFGLFNDLYNREVELIVTTNYQPDELASRIGDYSADRVAEMTVPVPLGGESFRGC